MEQQLVSPRHERLCDEILEEHPLVDAKLVIQNTTKKPTVHITGSPHRLRQQKSCVKQITFEKRILQAHFQPHVRIGRIVGDVGDHCVAEPQKRILVTPHPRIDAEICKSELLLLGMQRAWNVAENGSHLRGIPFGILFVIAAIRASRKTVSDAEYDKAVQSALEFLKEQALEKLGVDEDEVSEIEPILFGGYDFSNYTLSKQGKDGIWRTNKYEVVYLFFSQNEVHCYTLEFSTSESKSIESTDVYFYKDVVSVSTCSKSVKIEGYEYEHEMFKLVTAGGTVLEVSLKDVENSRNSINAMRQLLREKKAQ